MLLIEKAKRDGRKSFYAFCRAINPSFYKKNRTFLKSVCDDMQALYEGKLINPVTGKAYKKMALSLPPGHGKSYTVSLFSMWAFGQDFNNQIITASYNEKMASRFGATVRDGIEASKGEPQELIFKDFFPNVKVKHGDASKISWTLEGRYFSYLSSSFKASLTGMRANIGIIDDPIKNAEEAFNDTVLEDKWDWYRDTFLSRMLEGAIQIIIATRWATKDIIGRVIQVEPDEWYEIKMPALVDPEKEEMLCSDILSYETYMNRKKLTSPEIFLANYDQSPIDAKGKLYTDIKTYKELPRNERTGHLAFEEICNYTDTADQGKDFLASITYGKYQGQAFILDIVYTKAPMEITEKEVAAMLVENEVSRAKIESNNGGRGFARAVEGIIWNTYQTRNISIEPFHQSKNKQARILSNATFVMKNVFMPWNWRDRWPEVAQAIDSYQKEGKNATDDLVDCITGVAEDLQEGTGLMIDII